jgi:2'-5' RNA ligase
MSPRDPGERSAAVRTFVAVLLPEGLRRRIHEAAAPLRAEVDGVSWVREENLHVTLRFLGGVAPGALEGIAAALAEACAAVPAFTVAVEGLGGFPSARVPRVLWAGVGPGAGPLMHLHGRVEAALARCGIAPEARPFHPHVTLGRARDPRRPPRLPPDPAGSLAALGTTRVEAVDLVRSQLHPAGARYTSLARAPLAPAAGEPPAAGPGPERTRGSPRGVV